MKVDWTYNETPRDYRDRKYYNNYAAQSNWRKGDLPPEKVNEHMRKWGRYAQQ